MVCRVVDDQLVTVSHALLKQKSQQKIEGSVFLQTDRELWYYTVCFLYECLSSDISQDSIQEQIKRVGYIGFIRG